MGDMKVGDKRLATAWMQLLELYFYFMILNDFTV